MIFSERELEKYADVLIWGLITARSKRFKKSDIVRLASHPDGMPLLELVHKKCLERGWIPVVKILSTSKMEYNFHDISDHKQLTFIGPWEKELFNHLNGSMFIDAPDSITHLADIDPKKIGKVAVSMKALREIAQKREEEGLFGWTLCSYPTEARAEKSGLSLKQYKNQIVKACLLDHDDPVGSWKQLFKDAIKIKKWLNKMEVDFYQIQSSSFNLKVTPGEKRKWIGVSGHNIPSFEMFISPDWRGTEGTYYADQPSYRSGNYVEKISLRFEKGKVVDASAKKGNDFLNKLLKMDAGACQIGEFSLTDKRFSKINKFMASTLFDENYGGKNGNCHIACGDSYLDTYDGDPAELDKKSKQMLGFNESALHWDLVNTEDKTVQAYSKGKSKIIYQDGMFTCNL